MTEDKPLVRAELFSLDELLQIEEFGTVCQEVCARITLESLLARTDVDLWMNADLSQASDQPEEMLSIQVTILLKSLPLPCDRTLNSTVKLSLILCDKVKAVLINHGCAWKINATVADIIHFACEHLLLDERRETRHTPARNCLHPEQHEEVTGIIDCINNRRGCKKPARLCQNL